MEAMLNVPALIRRRLLCAAAAVGLCATAVAQGQNPGDNQVVHVECEGESLSCYQALPAGDVTGRVGNWSRI